ncbi:MAG: outer membrane protein [Syntrophobacteraceae bacterium]
MKLSRVVCFLSLACVLVFSQNALAAESAPSFNWTGFYAGIHLGYGQGDGVTTSAWETNIGLPGFTLSPHPQGIVGGVQAGYNWQCGCFVYGIEADFSGSGMSGSSSISPYPGYGTGTAGTAYENINWYGTLRPRVGYTVQPNVLIYATGGLAYGDVSYSANASGPINAFPASVSTTNVGWTLGGGVEYAVCKNWTIKAEYLYMDLGSESAVVASIPPVNSNHNIYDWQTTANIFQLGVNYKF